MFSQLQNRCMFLLYLNEFHINVYFYLVPEFKLPVEIVNVDGSLWAVIIKFRFSLLADKMTIALYINEFKVYFYLVPELNIPVEIVNVDRNLWVVIIKFRFSLPADKMPIAACIRSVFSECQ